MGMYGALILKPGDGSQSTYAGGPAYDRGYTMVLSELESDARARIQQGAGFDASTYTPNYFLMNGRAYADTLADASSVLRADLDQRVLIQVVNAGLTPHSMHLHGYHFQIVGRQGRPWPNGPLKDTVLVAPGDAYDLIYVSDQRGTFPFHDHYEFANTNNGVWMGGMLTLAFCPLPEEGSGELVALPGSAALAAVVDEPVAVEAPAASGPSIFIRDNFYAPNTLTVPAGTTVRWEHQGKVQHTVTALLGIFDSGPLNGGEVFTFTFDRPGRYDFFCRFHITNRGTITVQ
jgi:plastocyanin